MTAILILCGLALAGFAWAVANKLLSGMVGDELRTRVDRLAGVFVRLALRRLPPEMREFYRPDWEGVLLAIFYDETAGLPITRLFKSIKFGLSLWLGAGDIRKETKLVQQAAEADEKMEVLAVVERGVGAGRRYDVTYTSAIEVKSYIGDLDVDVRNIDRALWLEHQRWRRRDRD